MREADPRGSQPSAAWIWFGLGALLCASGCAHQPETGRRGTGQVAESESGLAEPSEGNTSPDDRGQQAVEEESTAGLSNWNDRDGSPEPESSHASQHPVHCQPGMAYIPPGVFLYGPVPVEVDMGGYCLDVVEVTVAEWNACVEAGGCEGFETWESCQQADEEFAPNQCVPDRDDYPANYLNWYRAESFCRWAGKRLPTSEEWEKGARGTDGRMHAWGEAPPHCGLAHQGRGPVFDECIGFAGLPDRPVPNHHYLDGVSPFGLLGTMGNVREWVEFREDLGEVPPEGTLGLSRGAEYGLGEWAISVLAVDSLLAVELASQGHGVRCAADAVAP